MHTLSQRAPLLTALLLTTSLLSAVTSGIPTAQAGGTFDQIPPDLSDLWLSIEPGSPGDLWLSIASTTTLPRVDGGTVEVSDEDVVYFDASKDAYILVFDGSDVGLSSATIDAVGFRGNACCPSELYLSFTAPWPLPGMGAPTADDSDVVKFIPTSYGLNHTAGTFELWFDGSQIGLTSSGEDIDAFDLIDDKMYFSTTGDFSVQGFKLGGGPGDLQVTASGQDEDLVACLYSNPQRCEYLRLVDMTALGFDEPGEDIDGLEIARNCYSTFGDYSVPGASGTNHDVIKRVESTPNFETVFHAADHGITSNVTGLEVPSPPGTE